MVFYQYLEQVILIEQNKKQSMSFQPNNYQQNYDQLSRNVISNTGGMKYNQIKVRKKGVPIDKEKLYEQNYQLRNKLKQLEETNLKLKTQLAVTEKQKESLFNMAEEQMFHPKIPQRSHSGSHKASSANPIDNQANITLLKQKQNSAIKKLVRDKHNENEQLRFQNQNIKKTMKFTRLNELITENNQLIEETKRLRLQIIESRNYADQFTVEYSNKIQSLRRDLQQERDSEKKNGVQLKKQFEANSQLRQKLRQSQLKKVQIQRRLNKQLKTLKSQNLDLRSRITNQMIGRQCQKPQCIKLKKERFELKKKAQQQQRQIKNLKDENLAVKRQISERQYHYKNSPDSNSNHKNAEQKRPNQIAEHKITNNSGVSQKKQSTQLYHVQLPKSEIASVKNSQPRQHTSKQMVKQKQQAGTLDKASLHQNSKQSHTLPNKIQPVLLKETKNEIQNKPAETNKRQKTVQAKNKTDESYNTEKLLQSYAQSNQHKEEAGQKPQKNAKIQQSLNQQQQYYNESQGEYQQIDFQEEEQAAKQAKDKEKALQKKQANKKKDKTHPQKAKEEEKRPQKVKEKEEKKPLQQKVAKSKSNKKVSKLDEGQQVLYQKDKKQDNQDDGKSELKLIKQTLTYKFNAQGYTYDDLSKDLSQSGKKSFSVTEMMDILTEEPFLLSEEHIETIIIYLFETDNLTGEQTVQTKNFLKKIKKFISKAKPLDKQTEEHNLGQLIALVQADEAGKKKIRSQCKKCDSGNGTINKQNFVKIMQGMKVGNELLQTAIAQIVYVSTDINNLNYDFFLKRFAQAQ